MLKSVLCTLLISRLCQFSLAVACGVLLFIHFEEGLSEYTTRPHLCISTFVRPLHFGMLKRKYKQNAVKFLHTSSSLLYVVTKERIAKISKLVNRNLRPHPKISVSMPNHLQHRNLFFREVTYNMNVNQLWVALPPSNERYVIGRSLTNTFTATLPRTPYWCTTVKAEGSERAFPCKTMSLNAT